MADRNMLRPTATCEAPAYICEFGVQDAGTWREAMKLARAHHKATGHTVRAEQIRTHLFIAYLLPEEEAHDE